MSANRRAVVAALCAGIFLLSAMASAGDTAASTSQSGLLSASSDGSTVLPPVSDHFRLPAWPPGAASPDFKLVDFDGKPRTLADYRGRVVVLFFGFVHCPDACPAELLKFSLAMKRMGAASKQVQVVFVTLDPDRDTPVVLKKYVRAFDPRFIALTGTHAQIDQAATSFFVQYAKVSIGDDYTVDHSTGTFVLDSSGRLRLLGTLQTSVNDLVHDLGLLLNH
jgi:protein SCO1/2